MYDLVLISKTADDVTAVEEHTHSTWEMFYVRVGTGSYHHAGQDYPFVPGDIFITRPGEPHFETSELGYGNYFVFFKDFFSSQERSFYRFHDAASQPVLNLLHVLYSASMAGNSHYLCSSVFESIHQFVRSLLPHTAANPFVEALKEEIEQNYRDPNYRLASSKQSPFSSDHLRRLFFSQFGVTPLQYLISLRINRAKLLINERSQTSRSLKEIAFLCGYSDYYYFSRQFKQQTGFSPLEWSRLSPYYYKQGQDGA